MPFEKILILKLKTTMKEKEYLEWFDSRNLGFEMFTKAGNKKCKFDLHPVLNSYTEPLPV